MLHFCGEGGEMYAAEVSTSGKLILRSWRQEDGPKEIKAKSTFIWINLLGQKLWLQMWNSYEEEEGDEGSE